MQLKHHPNTGAFWFSCPYDKNNIPRLCGLQYGRIIRDTWATASPVLASRLGKLADPETATLLKDHIERRGRNSLLSREKMRMDIPPCHPDGMALRDFQTAGVRFLLDNDAVLLADEMGLGKTIEIICAINVLNPYPVLIVCPSSLKLNWRNELDRWLTTSRKVSIVSSGKLAEDGDIVIINYDLLAKHKDWMHSREWGMVVADESHAVKSARAQRTRVFIKIKAKRKILSTGTPILNRPDELWTTCRYLWGDDWGDWHWHASQFCDARKDKWGMDTSGASNLKYLNRFLREAGMIRRLKADVLDQMPAITRQVIELPCNDTAITLEEKNKYIQLLKAQSLLRSLTITAKESTNEDEFRQTLAELRQGVMEAFSQLSVARHNVALYKLPFLLAHLKEVLEEVDCAVVFGYHRDILEAIQNEFPSLSVLLMGGMSEANKQESVDQFQRGDKRLFIGSLRAAGQGITLTRSSNVIFAELDWTPAILAQAEKRCDRIGQANAVLVQHLVLEASLDAYMANVIIRKQGVIEQAIGDKETSAVKQEGG